MNSEELEQSLRTEFESHLKQISADMQQEATEFQEKVEAEFERHKTQITEVFRDFSVRLQTAKELDASFKDSVVEYLRLARDEGARITATAIGEAEEMEKAAAAAVPAAGISQLRDAIKDISAQNSQASILKTLVSHAEQFTPRGAFFIIKNEHFVGWRVFGREEHADDQAAREIFFPVSTDSTLSESVRSLTAVESSFGTNSGDSIYLDKLEFGKPDKMHAIPLVARGRGVAVLYADRGAANVEEVNVEALETLVRVAGLTVEVLAATPGAKPAANKRQSARQTQKPAETENQPEFDSQTSFTAEQDYQAAEEKQFDQSNSPADYDSSTPVESAETVNQSDYQYPAESENFSSQNDFQTETAQSDFNLNNYAIEDYSVEEVETEPAAVIEAEEFQPVYQDTQTEAESYAWNQTAETTSEFTQNFETPPEFQNDSETYQPVASKNEYSDAPAGEYQFGDDQSFDSAQNQAQETTPSFDASQFESSSFES
ncbi:MAG: hypothetical protein M3525_14250, partial [Acidobacteriota bacterium]|nr:hypothetical protein [Acidobacteriota bacterium]